MADERKKRQGLQVQLQPPASTSIAPAGTTTLVFRVFNPIKAPVRVRAKITHVLGQTPFDDIADLGDFPQM